MKSRPNALFVVLLNFLISFIVKKVMRRMMTNKIIYIAVLLVMTTCIGSTQEFDQYKAFTLVQIGEVIKKDNRTFIVLDEQYQEGLMGLEDFDEVTVLYWFDQNDTPEKRSILKVHPRGNPDNPIRGVFATHAPVRPNLIAVSRCAIIGIEGSTIEVDDIDAFNHSPVLDLKN
jgi:tRNA-Thr(GGU) m(6)t(6)A37 methyltransferase TsaA